MTVQTGNRRLGQSAEDYLKAIFKLQTDEKAVSTNSLAAALSVSPAAATKAIQQLAGKELLHYQPYRGVSLTDEGRRIALGIVRRHRLLELFLQRVVGLSWELVDAEAERLEHHVSDAFIRRIDELLDHPRFDPHGAPIPTPGGELPRQDSRSLVDCEPPGTFRLARVVDSSPEMLQHLSRLGMKPGTVFEFLSKQPLNGPLTLRINADEQVLGYELAGHIQVEPAAGGPVAGRDSAATG